MVTITLIDKIKLVLTNPDKFFVSVKKEEGYGEVIKYTAVLSIVGSLLGMSISSLIASFDIVAIILTSLIVPVFFIIIQFIAAAITHILVILAGGKNGYSQTLKAGMYATTPVYLVGFLPLVSIIAALYSIYLNIKGLSVLQNISMGRAAAVILVPLLLAMVAVLALVGTVIFAILAAGAQAVA
ncbi:MAG: YIP1 family protein [Candidatus Aenigmarchaeota archaeon]|nr:YIP1 family protein [Candidatus Aenigmarchaeota archaeon]